jgi:ech hydrogenase subunit A
MDEGELLVLILLIAPFIASALCLLLRGKRAVAACVLVNAAVLMVASAALLAYLSWNGLAYLAIDSGTFYPISAVLLALDFALLFTFLAIGFRDRSWIVVVLALAQILPLALFEAMTFGEESEPAMIVDMLSVELILITSFIGSLICIYALKYMEHDKRQPQFFAAMLVFLAAMNGAVVSNNLTWLLVFWEATTLCSYLLIRHDRTEEAKASALRALIYTLGGGVAFVVAVIFLHEEVGTVLISELPVAALLSGLVLLPFGLLSIAAFTKSAQVPFQSWLLGAMVAPTPVSALLHSSTMVNLGVYLLLRLSPSIAPIHELSWAVVLVGAISFLATSVLAIGNTSSKRVLAYSTIGNLGLIVICAGIGSEEAIYAAMLLLLFHAISKSLLFLAVGVVQHETGSEEIENMSGLRQRMPLVTFALLVGVVTILLPPFGAFASKLMISQIASDYLLLAIPLALGLGASIVFYTKWMGQVFAIGPTTKPEGVLKDRLSTPFKATIWALIIGALVLPFFIIQITELLIVPYLGGMPIDPLALSTSYGDVPLLALLILALVMALAVTAFIRPKESETTTAYSGGEPYQFEVAGAYYLGTGRLRRINEATNAVAILVLALIVLIPIMQEASLWLM